MSITAMKQALEALNKNVGELRIAGARHILRTAIAEAEKQEPVGVVHHKPTSVPGADYEQVAVFTRALEPGTKLYTTPPAAQPAPVQEPVLEVVNGQINRSWDAIPAGFTGLLYMQSQSNVPPKKPKEPWYGSARVDDYNRGWNDCIDSINATPQPSHMPQPLTDEQIG